MKKFLKITAVVILSLVIFFVGTFKYRQYCANQVSIPNNAGSVVKVSVDEIYKSLVANLISHPGYYFKSDTKTTTKSRFDDLDHGLKIPASIYLYTIKNQPKTALFSRFEIKDFTTFENFLKSILHLNIEKEAEGVGFAKSKLGNITICYNSKNAAVVVSSLAADFNLILTDILSQKNFVELSKSTFNPISLAINHMVFADGENFATLNFANGAINFGDEFVSQRIIPIAQPYHRKFNSESAIHFWLNTDFKTIPGKIFKLKNASLEQDSLAKYYKGYVDFEWLNTIQQTDSIITYDYNDDFEKVEKVTLQKKDIPNFIVNISSDAIGLKNYLGRQNIINPDSGVIDKSIFPLYKISFGGDDNQLLLSTSKRNKVGEITESTNDFFALSVDFLKLNKQINQPLFTRYSKNLKYLEVKGRKQDNGKIQVNGKVELINKDINSLYQLLKGLESL